MVSSKKGKLFLIPVFLSETTAGQVFPEYNIQVIKNLKYFIVEHEKQARRFIKKINPDVQQQELIFFQLNKHTPSEEINAFLKPLKNGINMGLLSDSGMPAIADPGNQIVKLAHENDIRVIPLVGPSSVFLALASSGLNGQNFHFHGYLPIEKKALQTKIKKLIQTTLSDGTTHIFIETPYRNDRLAKFLISTLPDRFTLCIAKNLTSDEEEIKCKKVFQWKKNNPLIGKVPAIFLFGL